MLLIGYNCNPMALLDPVTSYLPGARYSWLPWSGKIIGDEENVHWKLFLAVCKFYSGALGEEMPCASSYHRQNIYLQEFQEVSQNKNGP